MSEITLKCPECHKPIEATISEIELKRLWSAHCNSITSEKRVAASRENGRKYGGRPVGVKETRPRKKAEE
jgi:endogenous inhibitor of DNA gyrase (YacG/DUF329 family)